MPGTSENTGRGSKSFDGNLARLGHRRFRLLLPMGPGGHREWWLVIITIDMKPTTLPTRIILGCSGEIMASPPWGSSDVASTRSALHRCDRCSPGSRSGGASSARGPDLCNGRIPTFHRRHRGWIRESIPTERGRRCRAAGRRPDRPEDRPPPGASARRSAASSATTSTTQSTTATLSPATASTLTLSFKTSGYHLFAVPASAQLYAGERAPRVDTEPHDANGVRKVIIGGRMYDHPVAQAQWGIFNVNSYIATKDPFYLNRAIANARQIVASRISVQSTEGVAWFFKYPFGFALHSGHAYTEYAPWYSGMAQGLAISLFTRLVKVDPGGHELADGG